jgi:hypothetical protein
MPESCKALTGSPGRAGTAPSLHPPVKLQSREVIAGSKLAADAA